MFSMGDTHWKSCAADSIHRRVLEQIPQRLSHLVENKFLKMILVNVSENRVLEQIPQRLSHLVENKFLKMILVNVSENRVLEQIPQRLSHLIENKFLKTILVNVSENRVLEQIPQRLSHLIENKFQKTILVNVSENRKERNVLFNDALNTFYLRLYGVVHILKYYSDSERKPTVRHGLLFPISSKGSFICIIPQTG